MEGECIADVHHGQELGAIPHVGSGSALPISSSSEVIDLERKEIAGGGNRLVCCGAARVKNK